MHEIVHILLQISIYVLAHSHLTDFPLVIEVVALLRSFVRFRVEFYQSDMVEVSAAFYHRNALDELLHDDMIVTP